MTETLGNGYTSESTQQENLCVLVLWMKITSTLEGLNAQMLLLIGRNDPF